MGPRRGIGVLIDALLIASVVGIVVIGGVLTWRSKTDYAERNDDVVGDEESGGGSDTAPPPAT